MKIWNLMGLIRAHLRILWRDAASELVELLLLVAHATRPNAPARLSDRAIDVCGAMKLIFVWMLPAGDEGQTNDHVHRAPQWRLSVHNQRRFRPCLGSPPPSYRKGDDFGDRL
mmetsp:Transcript_39005/g.84488  ORF Transcript_39005/g.84488 Transcript_39005/m.84488 type:complete len:113 (+) Transcript_39005:78-416(+)